MKNALISIIIPSYNSKELLKSSILSCINQTYSDIEIIVIDDGSSDKTIDLFPEFEKLGVKCFSQKNKGAAAARNLGLKHAKGQYIQYLDADDILHPDKIKLQIDQMQNNDADLSLCFWGKFVTNIEEVQPFIFKESNFDDLKNGKDIMRMYGMKKMSGVIHSWLTRRDLIDKAGLWNESLANNQDGEYFARVFIHAQKVSIVKDLLAYHRVGMQNTVSSINSLDKIESALKSWDMIFDLISKQQDETLLSYPKKGYFGVYINARNNYKKIAKVAAKRFDSIDAPCFLSDWKYYWMVKLFGLYLAPFFYYRLVNLGIVKITERHPI